VSRPKPKRRSRQPRPASQETATPVVAKQSPSKPRIFVLIALALGLVAGAMQHFGVQYWPIALGLALAMLLNAAFNRRKPDSN
jgi:hypothetical protein